MRVVTAGFSDHERHEEYIDNDKQEMYVMSPTNSGVTPMRFGDNEKELVDDDNEDMYIASTSDNGNIPTKGITEGNGKMDRIQNDNERESDKSDMETNIGDTTTKGTTKGRGQMDMEGLKRDNIATEGDV